MSVISVETVAGEKDPGKSKGLDILSRAQRDLAKQVVGGSQKMVANTLQDLFADMTQDENIMGLTALNTLWEGLGSDDSRNLSANDLMRQIIGEIQKKMVGSVTEEYALKAFDRLADERCFTESRKILVMDQIVKEYCEFEDTEGNIFKLQDLDPDEAKAMLDKITTDDKRKFASVYLCTHPEMWEDDPRLREV